MAWDYRAKKKIQLPPEIKMKAKKEKEVDTIQSRPTKRSITLLRRRAHSRHSSDVRDQKKHWVLRPTTTQAGQPTRWQQRLMTSSAHFIFLVVLMHTVGSSNFLRKRKPVESLRVETKPT